MSHPHPGSGSQPYHATDFMPLFPARCGTWRLAAAYPRLNTVGDGLGSATASAHYRRGEQVVVLSFTDVQAPAALFAVDPSLAGTHELDDGTMLVEHLHGRWVQERVYKPPYTDHVVGGFSYNMRIDPKARPLSDDCSVAMTMILSNGVLVTMKGPPDTNLVMLKDVLAGIDLDRAEKLLPSTTPNGQ